MGDSMSTFSSTIVTDFFIISVLAGTHIHHYLGIGEADRPGDHSHWKDSVLFIKRRYLPCHEGPHMEAQVLVSIGKRRQGGVNRIRNGLYK